MAVITGAVAGGDWNTGASWVGGVAPTAADDVLLTASSGNMSVGAGAVARSVDCTGYLGTVSGSGTLTVGDGSGGAFKLVAGMSWTHTGTVAFVSTSTNGGTGWGVTSGGKTFGGPVTFSGTGKYVLQDAFSCTTKLLTISAGTFDSGNQSMLVGTCTISGTSTVVTLGTTTLTTNTDRFFISSGTAANFSFGSSTIAVGAGFDFTILASACSFGTVTMTTSGILSLVGTTNFVNLSLLVASGARTTLFAFQLNGTIVVSGNFTMTGDSADKGRVRLTSTARGTSRSITVNGTNLITYADLQDIAAAGSASWNLAAITGKSGDMGGNTGITFTTGQTNFWVGNGGSWSDLTHWASTSNGAGSSGRVPLAQDDAVIDLNSITSASQTITMDCAILGKSVNLTGVLNSPTLTQTVLTNFGVCGSFTLVSGMTMTWGAATLNMLGRAASSLTTAGKTMGSIVVYAVGATVTQQDALTLASNVTFSLNNGTYDSNDFNVSAGFFTELTNPGTRTLLMRSGTWSVLGTGSTAWAIASTATVTPGTSTIAFTNTSATARTFAINGQTYNAVTFTVASTATLTVTSSAAAIGTLASLTISGGGKTLTLPISKTLTITNGTIFGDPGTLITVQSSAGGTATTISTPNVVEMRYAAVKDITAAGVGQVYAIDSTNTSGNTLVRFIPPDFWPSGRLPLAPSAVPRAFAPRAAVARAGRW